MEVVPSFRIITLISSNFKLFRLAKALFSDQQNIVDTHFYSKGALSYSFLDALQFQIIVLPLINFWIFVGPSPPFLIWTPCLLIF